MKCKKCDGWMEKVREDDKKADFECNKCGRTVSVKADGTGKATVVEKKEVKKKTETPLNQAEINQNHINKLQTIYNSIIEMYSKANLSIADALYVTKKVELGVLKIEENIMATAMEQQKKNEHGGMYG